ncbi:MAG: hypothetical protein WC869_05135 [Phycisphaerae bacterium]|jgi:hypothetical protein
MSSLPEEILGDIVSALRSSGQFSLVTLGPAREATTIPRAAVCLEGLDFFPADDERTAQWARLRVRVVLHTRSQSPTRSNEREIEICQAAATAILADPYRGGRCADLPIGRSSEAGRFDPAPATPKGNEVEASFTLRCHFVAQEESA